MSYSRILIHAVWATKERKPLMNKPNKDALCQHIREDAVTKGIHLLNINGWVDHLHAFISLTTAQNVETVINLLKGNSSHWASKNLNWREPFSWQEGFFAGSVSPSNFEIVNRYIDRQETHHRVKTFAQEYDELMNAFGLTGDSR